MATFRSIPPRVIRNLYRVQEDGHIAYRRGTPVRRTTREPPRANRTRPVYWNYQTFYVPNHAIIHVLEHGVWPPERRVVEVIVEDPVPAHDEYVRPYRTRKQSWDHDSLFDPEGGPLPPAPPAPPPRLHDPWRDLDRRLAREDKRGLED